jgi:hypothetical protein
MTTLLFFRCEWGKHFQSYLWQVILTSGLYWLWWSSYGSVPNTVPFSSDLTPTVLPGFKKKLTFTKSQENLLLILLYYDASVPCGSWEYLSICTNKTVSTDTDRDRQGSDIMARQLCNYHGIYSCSIVQDFYGPITGLVTASTSFSFGCA